MAALNWIEELKALLGNAQTAGDEGVWLDNTLGVAGTAYPIGTPGMPVSNLADARTICTARKTRKIMVRATATLTIDVAMIGYEFVATGKDEVNIDLNGQDCGLSLFSGFNIAGACASTSLTRFNDCDISGVTDFWGIAYNCITYGMDFYDVGTNSCFYNCESVEGVSGATFTVRNHILYLVGWKGPLTIRTVDDAASRVNIYANGSKVTIHSSCS